MKIKRTTSVDAVKFWDQFEGKSKGECWETKLHLTRAGYGRIWVYPKMVYTHRIAWILVNGEIPDNIYVCHKCDNPPCCNPAHLFLGTHAENMRDSKEKGRNRYKTLYGEDHPLSKLTQEDIEKIRLTYRQGTPGKSSPFSIKGLANEYRVAHSLIHRIIKGVSWPTKEVL